MKITMEGEIAEESKVKIWAMWILSQIKEVDNGKQNMHKLRQRKGNRQETVPRAPSTA